MITDFEKWANSKGYDLECRIRKRDDGSTYYDGYKDPLTQLASEAYYEGCSASQADWQPRYEALLAVMDRSDLSYDEVLRARRERWAKAFPTMFLTIFGTRATRK